MTSKTVACLGAFASGDLLGMRRVEFVLIERPAVGISPARAIVVAPAVQFFTRHRAR